TAGVVAAAFASAGELAGLRIARRGNAEELQAHFAVSTAAGGTSRTHGSGSAGELGGDATRRAAGGGAVVHAGRRLLRPRPRGGKACGALPGPGLAGRGHAPGAWLSPSRNARRAGRRERGVRGR